MTEVHLKIYGEVQGVGFRYATLRQAREFGLVGWVRNAPDGTVEIVAQGEKAVLESLINWIKTGPNFSTMRGVEARWQTPQEQYQNFEIQY